MKKFNIVDIAIVLVVIVGVFLLFNQGTIKDRVAKDTKKVRFVCLVEEMPDEIYDAIMVGDKLFAQYSTQPGEIKDIEILEEEALNNEINYEDKASARITCEAEVYYEGPYMQLGGQEVKAGIEYILKTEKFAVNSYITFVEVLQ